MDHNPTQQLTIETISSGHPDIHILKLEGPLTIHNFFDFQEITRKQPFPRLLVVDLTEVPYIDSAALGSFVGIHVSCEAGNRKYALVGANERLKSLFDLTHVLAFLVTFDTVPEALASLG